MPKDYYETLEVPKEASEAEIKKAYRKQALKYHPDKAPEDKRKEYEQKFKEVSEAYRVLSDKEKRSQYDQYGQTFDQGQGFGGGFSQQDFSSFYDAFGGEDAFSEMGFDSIFEDLFGFGQSRRQQGTYGNDLAYNLTISLEEAFSGLKKEIEIETLVTCPDCNGKGGQDLKKCSACQGRGYIQEKVRSILGYIMRQKVCPDCNGRGEVPEKKCHRCQGQGRIKDTKKLEVEIPAGIDNGQTLKLSGQGEAAPFGGPAGDLFVNVRIKPHSDFERRSSDLIYTLPLDFTQAALGDKIEVPAIDGKIKMKVPAGSQPNDVIKLKKKGMPSLYNHSRGDMLVRLQVEVPKKLSRQQKKIIEQLKEAK